MKNKLLILSLLAAFVLSACSSDNDTAAPNKEVSTENVETENVESPVEENTETKESKSSETEKTEENGYFQDDYLGDIQYIGIGYNEEIGIDGTDAEIKPIKNGPFELYINTVNIFKIDTTEESAIDFENKETAYALAIDMKAINTSDEDLSYYPDQAIITTDKGEQIEQTLFLSDSVGGDFLGNITKEGVVWWPINQSPEEIKSITLIVGAPSDSNLDDIGEETRLTFEVLNYQDALKKDGLKD